MKILASAFFLERPIENLDWVIGILVLTLVFIAIGRVLFSNNYEALTNIDRFQEINDNQALFGLVFQISFAVLSGAILIDYVGADYDFVLNTPTIKLVTIAFFILLFFGIRFVLGSTAAYAFGITQDRNFNMKATNYFRVFSVGLLWLAVLLLYFSEILKPIILVATIVGLAIIRFLTYRYLFNNQPDKQTKIWYYNILYLCALEILPLLVLLKYLNVW
ncbi:DUF4271 domain-containing protein [Moheibacter lacus]|uniref:DUF4271 domain-containing protein n=1 Tax=Moheibacter lacus TaxID=2745851 RepID=A0A838ZP29_9FLAO|nr:DUF4271 domain-containing protein [Moheibacter lacus]MBA5629097.1 DUF4271 domain-containing protein [Moheibacter lacus]